MGPRPNCEQWSSSAESAWASLTPAAPVAPALCCVCVPRSYHADSALSTGEDNKQDSTDFRCAEVGPTLLPGNVVSGCADPSRIKQGLLGFIRLDASLANMSSVSVIPVKTVSSSSLRTRYYYSITKSTAPAGAIVDQGLRCGRPAGPRSRLARRAHSPGRWYIPRRGGVSKASTFRRTQVGGTRRGRLARSEPVWSR